jgi:CO/xanthine dehydrogenase FAD-binding subunit
MYVRPTSLEGVVEALAAHGGRVLAGGTDIFPALATIAPDAVFIDLSGVPGLRGIAQSGDDWRIGARTTWSDIARADLPPCFDALKAAAREVGSVQIQNTATVAGNLCNASPAADGVPPLLALDAEVELASTGGLRRLPVESFLTGYRSTARRPDEIVTAILVPRTIEQGRSAFLKLGARRYLVISIAVVAVVLATDPDGRVAEARIAVGACSPVARRLRALEDALLGTRAELGIGDRAGPEHLTALSPIGDIRATAAYRTDAALTLVRRALEACVARA